MKAAVSFLIATAPCVVVYGDNCDDLNARAVTLYNSTECALVKGITLEHILTGDNNLKVPKNTVPESCTTTCIQNVSEVVDGIIDEGCSIATEGIAPFIYPIHDNDKDFIASTEFLCEHWDCAEEVKRALTGYDCNLNENGTIIPKCFERAPCKCLDKFLQVMENSSSDFQEDYGIDGKFGHSEIMAPLKKAYENGTCSEGDGFFHIDGSSSGTTTTTFGIGNMATVAALMAAAFFGHLVV